MAILVPLDDDFVVIRVAHDSRTRGRWLEIGLARIEPGAQTGSHHVHLDRLPIGGFAGHIFLHPIGQFPADPLMPLAADDHHGEEA